MFITSNALRVLMGVVVWVSFTAGRMSGIFISQVWSDYALSGLCPLISLLCSLVSLLCSLAFVLCSFFARLSRLAVTLTVSPSHPVRSLRSGSQHAG